MQSPSTHLSALARFLSKALPDVATRAEPPRCWAWHAIHSDIPELAPLSAAIQAVEKHGQIAALERRVRHEHHECRALEERTAFLEYVEEDARLRDCLTEACAFAWADLRGLGDPRFDYRKGMPDVHVPPDIWVEAKAVHESEASRQNWLTLEQRRDRAFEDKFIDAKRKFQRAGSGRGVVFYNLTAVDLTHMVDREGLLARYAAVLNHLEAAEPTVATVLCYVYDWRHPIRDTFAI